MAGKEIDMNKGVIEEFKPPATSRYGAKPSSRKSEIEADAARRQLEFDDYRRARLGSRVEAEKSALDNMKEYGIKKGGKVSSASSRADGIAQRGKTRGTMVMCGGGMARGKK